MSYTFEVGKSGAVKATHELGAVELVPHWTWHAAALSQLITERDTLRARLAAIDGAPTDETCAWVYDDSTDAYETACGDMHILIEGSPSDNCMKFCCYCGHVIARQTKDQP